MLKSLVHAVIVVVLALISLTVLISITLWSPVLWAALLSVFVIIPAFVKVSRWWSK
jgi:hypothetical protein